MKQSIYDFFVENFVEKKPIISREFDKYVKSRKNNNIVLSGLVALKLNLKYGVLACFFSPEKQYNYLRYPETEYNNNKVDISEYTSKIDLADVVSFDIFDTLILRNISDPRDIFEMLGGKFGIGDFKRCRIEAEANARLKTSSGEVLLKDIYEELALQFDIDVDEGTKSEIEYEMLFCIQNSFMKKVFDYAQEHNKKIIITSDMYLETDVIKSILNKCGYSKYDALYVSGEIGFHKGDSSLQKYISNIYKDESILHIGDTYSSDIQGSKRVGWKTKFFHKINSYGTKYRPYQMSWLMGSIYTALVNNSFYPISEKHNIHYEYGFTCGGILTWAFCQWIDILAKKNNIDKFLFLARDCDIISKVYNKYFGEIENEYVVFSRVASEKLILEDWFEEYLIQSIRVEFAGKRREKTIGELLEFCDLTYIHEAMLEFGISDKDKRGVVGYKRFRQFLYAQKEAIRAHYEGDRLAGKEYILEKIGNSKHVCVVDLGWRGSSILYIKHLVEKTYSTNVEVCGALMISDKSEYSDIMKQTQLISVFLDAWTNKGIDDIANVQKKRVALECLFSAEAPSLLSFYDNNVLGDFVYSSCNKEAQKSKDIQLGIMDFIDIYANNLGDYSKELIISAGDAIAPVTNVFSNKKFVEKVLENSNTNIGSRHGNIDQ